MLKRFMMLVIVATLSLTTSVMANSASKELLHYLTNIHSLTAGFTQKAIGKNSRMRQNTSGTMAILRPGRFRWDILKPSKQFIIADGKQLWIYDVSLQQVTVANLHRSIGQSPALLLSGQSKNLLRDYQVDRLKSRGKGQWYLLRAKSRNATYQVVKLHFVKGIIHQMAITDSLGQSSIVTFYHVTVNPKLSKNIFSFVPPKGVDVVRQS